MGNSSRTLTEVKVLVEIEVEDEVIEVVEEIEEEEAIVDMAEAKVDMETHLGNIKIVAVVEVAFVVVEVEDSKARPFVENS